MFINSELKFKCKINLEQTISSKKLSMKPYNVNCIKSVTFNFVIIFRWLRRVANEVEASNYRNT